jgi:two-component system, sensor histidine kinase and response regulator
MSKDAKAPGDAAHGAIASSKEAGSAPFLWNRAEALERLGGDEGLLRELCEIFLEESPKLLRNLRQAVTDGDASSVMRAAHSLRGEVGYLGAAAASEAAQQLEDMGAQNKLAAASQTLMVLEGEISGLHSAMQNLAGVQE